MSFPNFNEMASIASKTTSDHKIKVDNAILETNEAINKIILDFQKDAKIQRKRFVITTVISVFSLIAAVTAAVAALIPLL